MAVDSIIADDMVVAIQERSNEIVSTILNSCPELAIFGIRSSNKPDAVYGLGDPTVSTVWSGAQLPADRIKELEEIGIYYPLEAWTDVRDGKWMESRDTQAAPSAVTSTATEVLTLTVNAAGTITACAITATTTANAYSGSIPTLTVIPAAGNCGFGAVLEPVITSGAIASVSVRNGGYNYSAGATVIVTTTYNNGTATFTKGQIFARPAFKWAERQDTGEIYDRDVERAVASVKTYGGDAETKTWNLVSDSLVGTIGIQSNTICDALWYGSPTSGQTDGDSMYDRPFGFLNAVDDGTDYQYYAGVDRTLNTKRNYQWCAKVDTATHNWGFAELADDANLNKGINFKGSGIDLFIVSPKLMQKFRKESLSYIEQVNIKDELRELAKFGFTGKVIQYGDTYCVASHRCPEGTAIGLNMHSWVIAFKKGKKFQPSALHDQKVIKGGTRSSIYDVTTQVMPMCVAPQLNVRYKDVH